MRSGSRKPGEQRMGDTNQSRSAEGRIQRQVLEELERRASKDVLSGLLNRAALEHRIQNRLEDMTQEETCALFIVDLDNFKQVNDTLGHRAGDQAIRQSARSALLCSALLCSALLCSALPSVYCAAPLAVNPSRRFLLYFIMPFLYSHPQEKF